MNANSLNSKLLAALLSSSVLFGGSAVAQTVLESTDGNFRIEGELIGYTNEEYSIRTPMGVLKARREFIICTGDGCPSDESSKEVDRRVVLTSPDKAILLEGELLEVTDTSYIIKTNAGELTVRRELISCEGATCPTSAAEARLETLAVVGPDFVGANILSSVVQDYTSAKNLRVTKSVGAEAGSSQLLVGDNDGNEIAQISVSELSATDSVLRVLNGDANFAIVRRRMDPATLSAQTGQKIYDVADVLVERTVALDAISFVTNERNPLDTVPVETVKDILTGKITDWSQLGAPEGAISLHLLRDDSELTALVKEMVFEGKPVEFAENVTFHDATQKMIAAVQDDPRALSVMFQSEKGDLPALALSSECSIYYGSSDFSVQTQEYPFTVRWYMYARKDNPDQSFAGNLVSYLQTDQGQGTLATSGLLSQELRLHSMISQGDRVMSTVLTNDFGGKGNSVISDYLQEVSDSKRLSTSLRFTSGSSTPDGKALEDIERISQIVRRPEFSNYVVKLVGFSDSYGAFNQNVGLSKSRAGAIKDMLLDRNSGWLDDRDVEVIGAGPVAPVACNSTEGGRRLNRRVEVWIAPRARS